MNIAGTSAVSAQSNNQNEANMKVMSMAKDQLDQSGQQTLKLLDSTEIKQSSHPYLGNNVDIQA